MSNEQFFNEVKGKKIRRTTWSKKQFFIPRYREGGIMYGTNHHIYKNTEISSDDFWFINEGFNPTSSGNCWVYFKPDSLRGKLPKWF